MKTDYVGIDYGLGKVNINRETGIRYGVINQNEVLQAWADSSEPYYGDPCCPKCGNKAHEARRDFDYTAECGVWACPNGHVFYPMEIEDVVGCLDCQYAATFSDDWEMEDYVEIEYHCVDCRYAFGSESAYVDEPISWYFEEDGYSCECSSDDGDIFILKSPYYTYSQYCSPCAPGAGYLMNELTEPNEGNKTYCFGHAWFEDTPTKRLIKCYRCEGEGIIPMDDQYGHGGKQCWVCDGKGKRAETIQKAPYTVYSVKTGKRVNP